MTPNNPPRAHNPRCAVCAQSCAAGVSYCRLTGEFVCGGCLALLSISKANTSEGRCVACWLYILQAWIWLSAAKVAPVVFRLIM
jgi:hypothetical protein